jgi:hypothetical protein
MTDDDKPSRQLPDEEIRRLIRCIRHSSQSDRYGRRTQSINAVAQAAGLSRKQLYRIAAGEPLGPRARMELSRVLSCDVMMGERAGGRPRVR